MEQILSLPQDLKQLKGVDYKNFKSCTFAKYTQVSTSHSSFVNVGSHLLTFVRKGYKILHNFDENTQILDPIVSLKFEEIFFAFTFK